MLEWFCVIWQSIFSLKYKGQREKKYVWTDFASPTPKTRFFQTCIIRCCPNCSCYSIRIGSLFCHEVEWTASILVSCYQLSCHILKWNGMGKSPLCDYSKIGTQLEWWKRGSSKCNMFCDGLQFGRHSCLYNESEAKRHRYWNFEYPWRLSYKGANLGHGSQQPISLGYKRIWPALQFLTGLCNKHGARDFFNTTFHWDPAGARKSLGTWREGVALWALGSTTSSPSL